MDMGVPGSSEAQKREYKSHQGPTVSSRDQALLIGNMKNLVPDLVSGSTVKESWQNKRPESSCSKLPRLYAGNF